MDWVWIENTSSAHRQQWNDAKNCILFLLNYLQKYKVSSCCATQDEIEKQCSPEKISFWFITAGNDRDNFSKIISRDTFAFAGEGKSFLVKSRAFFWKKSPKLRVLSKQVNVKQSHLVPCSHTERKIRSSAETLGATSSPWSGLENMTLWRMETMTQLWRMEMMTPPPPWRMETLTSPPKPWNMQIYICWPPCRENHSSATPIRDVSQPTARYSGFCISLSS